METSVKERILEVYPDRNELIEDVENIDTALSSTQYSIGPVNEFDEYVVNFKNTSVFETDDLDAFRAYCKGVIEVWNRHVDVGGSTIDRIRHFVEQIRQAIRHTD